MAKHITLDMLICTTDEHTVTRYVHAKCAPGNFSWLYTILWASNVEHHVNHFSTSIMLFPIWWYLYSYFPWSNAYGKLVSSLYTNIILIDSLAFKGFHTFSYQKTQLFTKSIESLPLDLITYMSFIQLLRSEAAFTLQHIIINFNHIPVFRLQKRNYWQTDKNIN